MAHGKDKPNLRERDVNQEDNQNLLAQKCRPIGRQIEGFRSLNFNITPT